MSGKLFFDTNILIYAYDLDAPAKRERAMRVLHDAWENENGMLSTQVMQEFYVNVTRKIQRPIPPTKARRILETYATWHVEVNGPHTIFMASEIEERHRLSFWDSMIVAAAINGRAVKILTEDLNHGQVIDGIEISDPFL